MTKDEALHKALKVLNCLNNDRVYETAWVKGAINACKEALEQPSVAELNDQYLHDTYVEGLSQPAQEPEYVYVNPVTKDMYYLTKAEQPAQEPVGWMDSEGRFRLDFKTEIVRSIAAVNKEIPLYTHPAPSWQGLSDDEKLAIIRKWKDAHTMREQELIGLGDAFEQALKEKNHV